ncbi:MAG TPA: hypothetical protein VFI31_09310 [Pirellulales bacterium]|nr:hypothetical protein [Pirellulales bacterium]
MLTFSPTTITPLIVFVFCGSQLGAQDEIARAVQPPRDGELIAVVRSSAHMREAALLTDGVRAKFELHQINPGETRIKLPDGPEVTARSGLTAGDSISHVDFVAAAGKWRFNLSLIKSEEMPEARAGSATIEMASDGSVYTELDRLTGQGSINHTRISAPAGELRQNMELPTEYWLTLNARPLSEALVDPDVEVVIKQPGASEGLLILRLSFKDRGPVTLTVNPERDYLVEAADTYYDDTILRRSFRMREAEQLAEGLWVPKRWTVDRYGPSGGKAVKMNLPREWTLLSMTPHARPRDDEFRIQFPRGTMVADGTAGTTHQAGIDKVEHPDGDTANWAAARQLPMRSNQTNADRARWSYVFVVVNVIVVTMLGCLAWWRFSRRRPRAAEPPGSPS